jgi:hypothetical protein
MGLQSKFFRGFRELEAAAVSDPAHIVPGATGNHVALIQQALIALDEADITRAELSAKRYGPSSAFAVLPYKQRRQIINRSYQNQADNIIGKMTIAALDREMMKMEQMPPPQPIHCHFAGRRRV